jgi:hypothetical protein
MELAAGFLLGIFASTIAWLITEYAARPALAITPDTHRFQAQSVGNPPHEFYHVRVANLPAVGPLPGRRPAWACSATLDVFRRDGSRVNDSDIHGRWTSQPEPLLPVVAGEWVRNVLDPARVMQSRRMDVHSHQEELMAVAVKFEGELDCHIFTNESYLFPKWQNPGWRLSPGTYRLRVTVLYDRGRAVQDFALSNAGPQRDDLRLTRWRRD